MAAERLRVQAADHKRCMSERDQQVAELQQAFMQAQERARQPPTTPAADAARLQEVLRLQADLQSVQAAAERRERELLQQVGLGSTGWRQVLLGCAQGSFDVFAEASAVQLVTWRIQPHPCIS